MIRYDLRLILISQTFTRNREDAEDAVQEALLKAFQNPAEFREDSQFSTWLIRITVNQSLMKLRNSAPTKRFPWTRILSRIAATPEPCVAAGRASIDEL